MFARRASKLLVGAALALSLAIAMAGVALGAGVGSKKVPSRPNVILIQTDDQITQTVINIR